jgi:hypothetical protein
VSSNNNEDTLNSSVQGQHGPSQTKHGPNILRTHALFSSNIS